MNASAPASCPACRHDKCVRGVVDPSDAADDPSASSFHPEGVRHWLRLQGARLAAGTLFHCCLRCGLIWSHADPNNVVKILAKQGVPHGEVPKRASYLLHLMKWLVAIGLLSAALIALVVTRHP